jgi:hypothetical protein
LVNLLEDQFFDIVSEFNSNEIKFCDPDKFKLKFKMAGHTNSDTPWALDLQIKFLFVDETKYCVHFTKKSGCIVEYHN